MRRGRSRICSAIHQCINANRSKQLARRLSECAIGLASRKRGEGCGAVRTISSWNSRWAFSSLGSVLGVRAGRSDRRRDRRPDRPAALVALVLLARGWWRDRGAPKILDLGSALMFGGMALYAWLGAPDWSLMGVRLRVDGGLLLIVLISLADRQTVHAAICPRAHAARSAGTIPASSAATSSSRRCGPWRSRPSWARI